MMVLQGSTLTYYFYHSQIDLCAVYGFMVLIMLNIFSEIWRVGSVLRNFILEQRTCRHPRASRTLSHPPAASTTFFTEPTPLLSAHFPHSGSQIAAKNMNLTMKNYASVCKGKGKGKGKGENDHPNANANANVYLSIKQSTTKWTQPSKNKLPSVATKVIEVASKIASTSGCRIIKQTTTKPPQHKMHHNHQHQRALTNHSHVLPRKNQHHTSFSSSEQSMTKWVQPAKKKLPSVAIKYVLIRNLELNQAKLIHAACLSDGNMIRKTLEKFKYYDVYHVNIENDREMLYTLVLQLYRQLDRNHVIKLNNIFEKYNYPGFALWVSGKTGWYYSPDVNTWGRHILSHLNDLQKVVKTYAPPELLHCFPGESKTIIWCKSSDLWRCVLNVRFFVERAKTKLPDTPSARRIRRCLLQNSDEGPDSLLHWSHHDPVSFVALIPLHFSSCSFYLTVASSLSLCCRCRKTTTL
jgi:hypothetical protein